MKSKISLLFLMMAMAAMILSCSKEKTGPALDNEDALEEIFTEDVMEDVFSEVFNDIFGIAGMGLKSEENSDGHDCRTRTVELPEEGNFPKVVTLEFDGECKDRNGNVRSGKIIITIHGPYKRVGTVREVTFEDYYLNGNKIEGNKTVTTLGRNGDGNLVFKIEIPDSRITRKDSIVIERVVEKTRVWIAGEDTREVRQDNEWLINGVITKVNKNGVLITRILNDIHRAVNCRWPLSGYVEINGDDGRPTAVLDYGDGKCDKWATITIGDDVWRIDLKNRGKRWKVEKEDDDD
jgi:hypothetical protein